MTFVLCICGAMVGAQAQVMKAADLEKYAKERYGEKWLDAAANLAKELNFDKNQSLTYQQIIEAPGKTAQQLYVMLNYWATATFKDKQAITLNDKEMGCIIISSPIDAIADHTGTLNRYVVNITPIIKIDIKEGKVRVVAVRRKTWPDLSAYWARHTWASIARSLGVPMDVIAQAMGHSMHSVTDIYIARDSSLVDEANRKVIDWVLYGRR